MSSLRLNTLITHRIFALSIIVLIVQYAAYCMLHGYFLDEAITHLTASRPVADLIFQRQDYSAPLHSLLEKILLPFCIQHKWILRVPSMSAGILGLAAVYYICRSFFDPFTSNLSCVLLSTNKYYILNTVQARSYGLFYLFSMLSIGFCIKASEKYEAKWVVLYVIASILLMYSQFLGFFVFAALFFFSLLLSLQQRAFIRKALGVHLIILLLTLPAAYLASRFVSEGLTALVGKWLAKPGLLDILIPVQFNYYSNVPYVGIVALYVFIIFMFRKWFSWKWADAIFRDNTRFKMEPYLALAMALVFCHYALIAISLIYKPVYSPRYGVPTIGILVILVSNVIYNLNTSRRVLISVAIVVLSLANSALLFLDTDDDYKEIAEMINESNISNIYSVNWSHTDGWINPEAYILPLFGARKSVSIIDVSTEYHVRDDQKLCDKLAHDFMIISFSPLSKDVVKEMKRCKARYATITTKWYDVFVSK